MAWAILAVVVSLILAATTKKPRRKQVWDYERNRWRMK